jgi:RNA polymerase sigma-70 factor (sigma-E family)
MNWLWGGTTQRHFERFAREITRSLVRTGYLMTWDLEETEDIVQETLLRVSQRWDQVRSMEHPAAYARRILVNLVIDGHESRSRRKGELSLVNSESVDHAATLAFHNVELVSELGWALALLPRRQRAMVVLRYWLDLPEAEVAEILSCSVGTVKSTTSRAVARLREVLSGNDSPEGITANSTSQERRATSW